MGDDDRKCYKVRSARPWPRITASCGDKNGGMTKAPYNMKIMMWKHMQYENNALNIYILMMMCENMHNTYTKQQDQDMRREMPQINCCDFQDHNYEEN